MAANIIPYNDKRPQVDDSAFVDPTARIIGDVVIGRGAGVWAGAVIRGDDGQVVLEEGAMVLEQCVVEAPGFATVIGRRAIVSHSAVVHGARVGAGSVVGIGAILLDGVSVGEGCLIGSGAVISPGTEIPDGKLVLGLPGRVVRDLTDQDRENAAREWDSLVQKARVYKGYYDSQG